MSRITLFEFGILAALLAVIVVVCAVNQLAAGTTIIASTTMIGAYLLVRPTKNSLSQDKHIGFH